MRLRRKILMTFTAIVILTLFVTTGTYAWSGSNQPDPSACCNINVLQSHLEVCSSCSQKDIPDLLSKENETAPSATMPVKCTPSDQYLQHSNLAPTVTTPLKWVNSECIQLDDNSIYKYFGPKSTYTHVEGTKYIEIDCCIFVWYSDGFKVNPKYYIEQEKKVQEHIRIGKSPLLLDMTGDGVQTTSIDDGVIFDIDACGQLEKTAWAAPGTGILVRDLNGNGRIDNGAELFGDNTVLQSGEKAANGFLALADLDLNKDGRIDTSEAKAAELRIWKDDNINCAADEGELLTFEEAGVLYINLSYTVRIDADASGNYHVLQGRYVNTDGNSMSIIDVWLMGSK